VGTPLRLEPDPGLDFGTVLLGRTLDAETSEHDLQSDMTTVTTARHAAGSRLGGRGALQAAKLGKKEEYCTWYSFKGTEGREGLAIQAFEGLPLIALTTVRGVKRAFN
jgi:hypothetical protein